MHLSRAALTLLLASAPLIVVAPAAHADLAIKVSPTCTYSDSKDPKYGLITSTVTITGQGFSSDETVGKRGTVVVKVGQSESIDNYTFDKVKTDKDGSFTTSGTVTTPYRKQLGYPTESSSTDIYVMVGDHHVQVHSTPSVSCVTSPPPASS